MMRVWRQRATVAYAPLRQHRVNGQRKDTKLSISHVSKGIWLDQRMERSKHRRDDAKVI
jgi:hypothetical protein